MAFMGVIAVMAFMEVVVGFHTVLSGFSTLVPRGPNRKPCDHWVPKQSIQSRLRKYKCEGVPRGQLGFRIEGLGSGV